MSDVRTARIVDRESFGESCRMLFEMSDGRPLGFIGGQYLILDTGLLLPDGRPRKRAYSMLSSDGQQARFELAARRLDAGLGSQWLSNLPVGAEIRFSGPWGKLRPPADAEEGPVWVVSTDTGVTAALGLGAGLTFAKHLPRTRFVWWAESPSYFLSSETFFAKIASCAEVRLGNLPPVGTPERLAAIEPRFEELYRRGPPTRVYLIGDGHVTTRAQAILTTRGLAAEQIQTETFFHHVKRKIDAERAA